MTQNAMGMQQMMGDPLEVSASAVDQLVQFELDNINDELEDRKIQFERQKREELKNLEHDKRNMKLKLQTDAERDLDALRNRLEMERQTQSQFTISNRKVELESHKEAKVVQAKERFDDDSQSKQERKQSQFDSNLDIFKKDCKERHEKEQ